jgi:hypothetical protein
MSPHATRLRRRFPEDVLDLGRRPERHYHEVMPTEIDADQVQRLLRDDGAVLIEVLPEGEYGEEHLPGAINIPLKRLNEEAVGGLDRSRPVIVYCHDDL